MKQILVELKIKTQLVLEVEVYLPALTHESFASHSVTINLGTDCRFSKNGGMSLSEAKQNGVEVKGEHVLPQTFCDLVTGSTR